MNQLRLLAFVVCAWMVPAGAFAAIGAWETPNTERSTALLTLGHDIEFQILGSQVTADHHDLLAEAVYQQQGDLCSLFQPEESSPPTEFQLAKCSVVLSSYIWEPDPVSQVSRGDGPLNLFVWSDESTTAHSELWGVKVVERVPEPTGWLVTGLLTLLLGFGAWIGEHYQATARSSQVSLRRTANLQPHSIARLILQHAPKFLCPQEALAAAAITGMPQEEAQAYLMALPDHAKRDEVKDGLS